MNLNTNDINQKTLSRAFYEVMTDLAKSEDDPILLGWRDKSSQTDRFDVFVETCFDDGDSVLDFGCGIADLYPYIKDKGLNVDYTGIDIMQSFIKMAKDRYGDEVKILNTNVLYFLEKFDWVFASGVFSIGFDVNQLIEHISHFVKISNKGVCFNLLDKDKFEGDVQVSFLQNEIINTIKNKFPELNLTVVNTYSVDDFTIILKK